MAKRPAGNSEYNAEKRPKIGDFDDLWDEDLDIDAIDDCFKLATQVCSKEDGPSYTSFKLPKKLYTSTQNDGSGGVGLQIQVKQLQERCEEKEGEISILRANLKDLRATQQVEQEKKQQEWKDKLAVKQKEVALIRSELDFKNLEVANLKQRNLEVQKKISEISARQERSPINSPVKQVQARPTTVNTRIFAPKACIFPLRGLVFDPEDSNEVYVGKIQSSSNKNTIPYLQNQMSQEEVDFLTSLSPKPVIIFGKKLDLDYIHPEVSALIRSSQNEIDSRQSIPLINKVVYISFRFLKDFCDYLACIESNTQIHEIQQADSLFLQNNNIGQAFGKPNQIGVPCAKTHSFLAELLPHSSYLKNYFLEETPLSLDLDLDYVKALNTRPSKHFNLLLDTVSIIGRIRKATDCSLFLSSVVELLTKVFSVMNDNNVEIDTFLQLTRQVLFARPTFEVLSRIPAFFKEASKSPKFTSKLCCNPTRSVVRISLSKGISYFSAESCTFHLFAILFENMLSKKEVPLSMSCDMLVFIQNVFQTNPSWVYYKQEEKKCECLNQLYKLLIGIVYRNVKKYKGKNKTEYAKFSKRAISVLSLLSFNSYEVIEKYITVCTQFKEVVYILNGLKNDLNLNKDDLNELENLNLGDEIPETHSEVFDKIRF